MSSTQNRADKPLGYAQSTALAASVAATSFFSGGVPPSGTAKLRITPETAAIRWRDDGTAPTTTVGYPLAIGAELVYEGNPGSLLVIGQTNTAVIDIVAYG